MAAAGELRFFMRFFHDMSQLMTYSESFPVYLPQKKVLKGTGEPRGLQIPGFFVGQSHGVAQASRQRIYGDFYREPEEAVTRGVPLRVYIWWFPKIGVPHGTPNHPFLDGICHCKPSIFGGYLHLWKPPCWMGYGIRNDQDLWC